MSVSVIIPTHNRLEHLARAIYFLNKWQTHRDFEVIISDDNSSDDILSLYERIKHRYDFEIKLTSYKNKGAPHIFQLSKARNAGIKMASKEILLIMDCDRILSAKYIYTGLRIIRYFGKKCAVGGRTAYLNSYPQNIRNNITEDELVKPPNLKQYDPVSNLFRPDVNIITKHNWSNLYGGGVMIPREFCNSFNGFDESYMGWGAEDLDFARRIRRNGGEVLFAPIMDMYHMNHDYYHEEYNLDAFEEYYGKKPYDFTQENNARYFGSMTDEERENNRS